MEDVFYRVFYFTVNLQQVILIMMHYYHVITKTNVILDAHFFSNHSVDKGVHVVSHELTDVEPYLQTLRGVVQ